MPDIESVLKEERVFPPPAGVDPAVCPGIPGFRRGTRWFIPRPAYETFLADPATWKGRVSND